MINAGYAIQEITPQQNCPLAGYDLRKQNSVGVHDSLSVRAVVLREGDAVCVFCVADLLGAAQYMADEIRSRICKRLPVSEQAVMISAIHTHAAPQSVFSSFACYDPAYAEIVIAAAVRAAEQAFLNCTPVTMRYAHTTVEGVASYRDRVREQSAYAMPCDTLYMEPPDAGKPPILLTVYACHPTVLNESNLLMSRDMVYGCDKRLKERMPDIQTCFLNGACADVSTRYTRRASTFAEAERLGAIWADAVWDSVKRAEEQTVSLSAASDMLFVPPAEYFQKTEIPDILAHLERKMEICADEQQKREYSACRSVLKREHYGSGKGSTVRLGVISLGEIWICALPFEYASADAVALSERIRQETGHRAVICCYSNGYEGYLPSGKPLCADSGYEDMASNFRYDAKILVADAICKMTGGK